MLMIWIIRIGFYAVLVISLKPSPLPYVPTNIDQSYVTSIKLRVMNSSSNPFMTLLRLKQSLTPLKTDPTNDP